MSVATKIVAAIAAGRFDDYLEVISASIAARRRAIVETMVMSLKVNDVVKFDHRSKPKYLRGARAKIVSLQFGEKYPVTVELLDHRSARYRRGILINCTGGQLEKEK
jgi:hypothetical protein